MDDERHQLCRSGSILLPCQSGPRTKLATRKAAPLGIATKTKNNLSSGFHFAFSARLSIMTLT
jgi:hypothetical protein